MNGAGDALRGEHLIRHFKRLLEADRTAQAMGADLEEDLVGGEVVRIEEELGEDFRQAARLPVNIDRLEILGHGSDRDFAMDGAAGPPDEGADQFARVFEAERRDPVQD